MNSFFPSRNRPNPEQIKQIKAWMYEHLAINQDIPISISQLQCSEPDCPPIETVIAVMTTPPQQYKIHKSASEITVSDIEKLSSNL